jgi:prephenate dehydrogenase
MAADDASGGATGVSVIAVVGLGDVGRALATGIQRVKGRSVVWGHDRDAERARQARREGAVDDLKWNLVDMVSGAGLVVVAEPLSEALQTIEAIADHVPARSVVVGCLEQMAPGLEAARRALPSGVHYVAMAVPPPAHAAGARPFEGADICLAPLPESSDASVATVANLVGALGARPFFIDPEEHDALVPAVRHVPRVLAAALRTVQAASPSAPDLRRLQGRAAAGEEWLGGEPGPDDEAMVRARAETLPWLDQLLASLQQWRAALAAPTTAPLGQLLEEARGAERAWHAPGDAPTGDIGPDLEQVNPLRDMLLGRGLGTRKAKDRQ